jgi:parvulin-like peptidyl-prolyl isomerase
VTPEVIANAVDELLLVQRGRDLGYSLSDEQFAEIVSNLREENQFETQEEFEAALRDAEGLNMSDLRRLMENQMLVSQVQQIEILSRVAITDVEAREYYDTHPEEFTQPATATLRQLLIPVDESPQGVSVASDDEARVVAETTVARLRSGEDFATVAAELSGASPESGGGLIGPLLVSEFSEAIQDVVAELEVGGVAEPRRTPQGYQIIRLEARTDPVLLPFDEVRDNISNNVFNDRRLREFARYLDELRSEAVLEWKNDELRLAYEQFRSNEANSASAEPLND